MSDPDTTFHSLMERAKGGDDRAAEELYARYSRTIRQVARARLNPRLRDCFDSVDFVQDVWVSFFKARSVLDFETPEALVAYLARMARNKVVEGSRRYLGTQSHSLNREVTAGGRDGVPVDVPAAGAATPSQEAIAREEWNSLTEGESQRDRRILSLLLQGYTHREVADLLNIDRKTIHRLLVRLDSKHE